MVMGKTKAFLKIQSSPFCVTEINSPKGGVCQPCANPVDQTGTEYLIEQLQFSGESSSNSSVKSKLTFNHPCKELVWVVHSDDNADDKLWSDYSFSGAQTIVDAKLQLNGHDRFSTRKAAYFNLVQPYQNHTRVPDTGIYVYSFAINPEQHQPSGTVNMSRIDNATLSFNLAPGIGSVKIRVYAINYNVLRIMAGMGGLKTIA